MRKVTLNVNDVKGKLDRYFSQCIGAGRAGEVMRLVPAKQLERIQRECPFSYIRFHGLFYEEMDIVSRKSDGTLRFHFQYVDHLFDQLLENNIRPVAELGLMPEVLAKEQAYVFWWKMNKSAPKDLGEWSQLIEAFVRHVTDRYGEEEIKKWYFEIWNEPNLKSFFTEYENIDAYFALYDAAAAVIKKINPEYKVGGPATAGCRWIEEMIAHCKENNVPLDFISSHGYGVKTVKDAFDEDGRTKLTMLPVDQLSDQFRQWGKVCHDAGLPFIITEWSSSYSSRDPVHDSYFNAAYILHTIKRVEGFADMFSYWVYTDIFEEVSPPRKMFHGGFGLLTTQSVPKPSYYAFEFLSRLGDTELACTDENVYACKKDGTVQILAWNIVQPQIETSNQDYFNQSLPAKRLTDTEITVSNMEPGKTYRIDRETIGYRKGDVYQAYLDGGYGENPNREEIAVLMEKAKPEKSCLEATADENGVLRFVIPQTENQVDFLTIKFV